MSEKAFPSGTGWNHDGEWVAGEQEGMDLRDWFAGQALAGLCVNPTNAMNSLEIIVRTAYKIADHAMEQREK